MRHVDPVEGAVDGGALGVELSVAAEFGAMEAEVVPDLREARVDDAVGDEAVVKQHVAIDLGLDDVDCVVGNVQDARAAEVESAVDLRAQKAQRAEITVQKRRVAVDDGHVAEHRAGARAAHGDVVQMGIRQVDSVGEVAADEGQRLLDGGVGEVEAAGDARAGECESTRMHELRGLRIADEPCDEVGADGAVGSPIIAVRGVVGGIVGIVARRRTKARRALAPPAAAFVRPR